MTGPAIYSDGLTVPDDGTVISLFGVVADGAILEAGRGTPQWLDVAAMSFQSDQPLRVLENTLALQDGSIDEPSTTEGTPIPADKLVNVTGTNNIRGLKLATDADATGAATVSFTLYGG